MGLRQASVVVDCERMKYPYTGLYQFCLHLSKALLRQNTHHRLCFYTPPSARAVFGPGVCYRQQRSLHKLLFPSLRNTALWHSTHQSTDYFPRSGKARTVLTVHDLNYLHDESKSVEKRHRFLASLRQKIDRADAVVTISQFTLRDLQNHLPLAGKHTKVIYNGCTVQPLATLAPPPLVPPAPFLFTVGTITPKKNFAVLPRLLPRTDLHLVVAGLTHDAAYKNEVVAEAKRWGVHDRLHFVGPVGENDKQWYLQHCEAFVFPSLAEGFGLPVVEAMYFGTPVLLANSTSLPEVGGSVSTYFSSFEPEAMQQALADCLARRQNPAHAAALRQRAGLFSWDEAARQYLSLYDDVLQGG